MFAYCEKIDYVRRMKPQDVAAFPPLTRSMHDARMEMLRTLAKTLRERPPSGREAFTDMMTAAFREGGLDVRELASDMGYSMSACYRWTEGVTATVPHASQWGIVTDWVTRRIDAILTEGTPA